MKKNMLLFGMLALSSLGFAQVSKQQVVQHVMNTVVGNNSTNVNVYMESEPQSGSYYKLSQYDSISAPYPSYWLFFIDDMPEYGWGHDCRYVFVNQNNGSSSVFNGHTPPLYYKLNLETVSEPIALITPPVSTDVINLSPTNSDYPSNSGKYAFLFTGGELYGDNHVVFWNALCHSYCGLVENGFKKENIFVLSCNGGTANPSLDFDKDGQPDIMDLQCSLYNIELIMDSLSMMMQDGDIIYVYGTMHGDTIGNHSYLHLWNGEKLFDYQLADMLSRIHCSQYVINIWSCFSGGMSEEVLAIPNDSYKVVLTCTGNRAVGRESRFNQYAGMDIYNYAINSALRNCHPVYPDSIWCRGRMIGLLQDTAFFSRISYGPNNDINYDSIDNGGNGNGIHEIGEAVNYTAYFNPSQFGSLGVKHYDCGFKDDLLSLRGVTGKVKSVDTVSGSFHIEDTLSICADTLTMENYAKFYLFDADLIIEDTSSLVMGDSTAIIARSGNCRVVVKGGISIGDGTTFEARDGSTLQVVFENDADLAVSNASFINCDLVLPERNLSFTNCRFIGTPFSAVLSSFQDVDFTVTLTGCGFTPNRKDLSKAVYVNHYPNYLVQGCSIDASGEGSYEYGIAVHNSGSDIGAKCIRDNFVTGCQNAGVIVYASHGDVRTNTIEGNGYGVKLFNNSNIERLTGNCEATTAAGTQYIHDNEKHEVFMTSNCIPEIFNYNYISDDDDVPFVYYDPYIGFVGPGVYPKSNIDVTLNYWGTNFSPSTHLYSNSTSTGYDYLPCWSMGQCAGVDKTAAASLLSEADSLNYIGEYVMAKSVYMQVVDDYPSTVSAEAALKTLIVLEELAGNNYDTLKNYYQTNQSITTDENLSHLALSLANKCDERLGNYDDAIAWYEEVLTNPNTSFNDSIFASIDLGDLYLRMDEGREKGACGKLVQYKPESVQMHDRQTSLALSMIPQKVIREEGSFDNSPVQNLEWSVGSNDRVLLTWDIPEGNEAGPTTLSWVHADTINDMAQYGHDSYMGAMYDSMDLRHFVDWKIASISFYKVSNWTHYISVWEKRQGEDMHELYIQEVPEEIPFGLNTIMLEEDLSIEPSTQYWFAVRIKNEGQFGYTYPFGMVSCVEEMTGKSDLWIGPGGSVWQCLPGFNGWIKTVLTNTVRGRAPSLTGFRIYREGMMVKEIPYSFVTYYTDSEFSREADVEYCVTAVYGEEESEPVCVTATITGMEETASDNNIILSPNPTSGIVRITGASVAEVQVYNTLGQLLKTIQSTNEINLEGLPQGVYTLRITDEKGFVVVRKVVKE